MEEGQDKRKGQHMQFCTTAESDMVQNNTADTKALPQRPEEEMCARLSFLISMTSVLKSSHLKLLWHICFLSLRLVGDAQC